jgi:hypothetical protein
MATNTTRLGLIKPDYVDDVDIADINSNMDDIDSAVGATICTSTTRPGTPFTGQLIFETNTDKFLVWTGSVWEESVGGAEALNDLTDVTITGSTANRVLRYNGSAWVNGQVVTNDITDANVTSEKLGPGTILQVVSTTKTDVQTTSSTSFIDVTGLEATITPLRTTSKILVMGHISGSTSDAGTVFVYRLLRGATEVGSGTPAGNRLGALGAGNTASSGTGTSRAIQITVPLNFLDSPNTTSATIYKLQIRNSNDLSINASRTDGDSTFAGNSRTQSTITLMEVAG